MKYTFQITMQVCIVAVIIAVCAAYLWRVKIARPPIGRFNIQDVVAITILIVVTPFGYVQLPVPVLTTLFGLVFCIAIQTALGPVIGNRTATVVTVLIAGVDVSLAVAHQHVPLTILNDVFVALALIGVTNLWVQSGAKAKHVAMLAGVLAIFDPLATWMSPLMGDLFVKLTGEPFAPMLSLTGTIRMRLGLGDCLMFVLWPLVLSKAYGRLAAWVGAVIGVAALAGMAIVFFGMAWINNNLIAVMSIFGPLILIQYAFLRIFCGPERRTSAWRRGLPRPSKLALADADEREVKTPSSAQLMAALAAARMEPGVEAEGRCMAYHNGILVGSGPTAGQARRAARLAGCEEVPVVVGV